MTEDVPAAITEDYGEDAPSKSQAWLALIERADKAGFKAYDDECEKIDKAYASLEALSRGAVLNRDTQFQIFWANIQVLCPSIYSRPPVPVVTPRFQDRDPLKVAASELLERAAVVNFETQDVDYVLRLVRDDLAIGARGAVRLRFEERKGKRRPETACIEHLHRTDFRHDPARNWNEVDWVAYRAFLTERQIKDRKFKNLERLPDGERASAIKSLTFEERKDEHDNSDGRLKAPVWEIWSKSQSKVVWVAEGMEDVLEEGDPHLDLEGFFPSPRPAYATVQRGSLVPVPDYLYYRSQIEQINALTTRINLLLDAVKLRGFYPSGAGDLSDAIETAVKNLDDRVVMVPVSDWAAFGNGSAKDTIVWLPLEMIVIAIKELVAARKQLIDDVYEITGLSDIMRGSTVASETLGAQQLKSQYGSVRIRDKQDEMTRIARDVTRLAAEIQAENFSKDTLFEMAQSQVPTKADLASQVKEIERQLDEAKKSPAAQQAMQQNPAAIERVVQAAAQHIEQIKAQVTQEDIVKLIRDQRVRPFAFDIETDSTIAPDENANKQRATEYVTSISALIAQAAPVVQQVPQLAPVIADILKFANKQFRADRQVQATVDEFADQMKQLAQQPAPPDPAHAKAQADAEAAKSKAASDQASAQATAAKAQADAASTQADAQSKAIEAQTKAQDAELQRQIRAQEAADAARQRDADLTAKQAEVGLRMQQMTETHGQDMEKGALELELLRTKIVQASAATDNAARAAEASIAAKAAAPKPNGEGARPS